MLSLKDFDEVEKLVREVVKEEIKHLPSKDEFYSSMDQIMGELNTLREEFSLHQGQHLQIDKEFDLLKKRISSVV